MAYPYYQDPITGVPAGRYSAPMSRATISNPITPYGIPYTPPSGSGQPSQFVQQRPSTLRRVANFLGKAALIGAIGYGLNKAFPSDDDGDTPPPPPSDGPPKSPTSDNFSNQPQINTLGYPGEVGAKKAGGDYLTTDPEEVGGLRSQVSKDFLSDFRKNISVPSVESEIVGSSPEQEARSKTWISLDNDRFFDHPDTNTPGVPDEVSNVPDAGKQHLDSYASDVQRRFYPVTELPDESSHVSGVTLYPQAGVTTWNLRGRDGGTSPYSYHTPEPVMEALTGMSEEGTLSNESLGGIHNTLTGRGGFDPAWGKEKDLGQMIEAMNEEKALRAKAKAEGTKRKSYKSPYGSLLTKIAKFDPESPSHLPGASQKLSEDLEKVRYDKDIYPFQGGMSNEEYFNQGPMKIAKMAVDNPDFDSEAYYDNKKKWIEDQMD